MLSQVLLENLMSFFKMASYSFARDWKPFKQMSAALKSTAYKADLTPAKGN